MKAKADLRKYLLHRRASVDPEWKSRYDAHLCEALFQWIHDGGFQRIHTYIPMGHEVDLMPLLRRLLAEGLTLVAPETLKGRRLKNWVIRDLDDLQAGIFGTRFPRSGQSFEEEFDLILVPGLGFDARGFRLGYGGGYYDAFLSRHPESFKVAAAYPFQMIEDLPLEEHDIPVDQVLFFPDISG
jgi:5-formyltetrahydrofolate cyclo-ligase